MSALNLPLALQYVFIALAIVASLWVVFNKQFPGLARKLRIALALPMLREGRPSWLRAFGKAIAPATKASTSGCDGCSDCKSD